MTTPSDPAAPRNKGGRPLGSFGLARRQEELVREYTMRLGGPSNTTAQERRDIVRAVSLQAIAEEQRRKIAKHGASSASESLALARLEEVASHAVEKLRLPCGRGFNPREDYNREMQNK